MKKSKSKIRKMLGASLVEMALVITLVAVVAIPSVIAVGKVTACKMCFNSSSFKRQGFPWGNWATFYGNCLTYYSLYTTGYVCEG